MNSELQALLQGFFTERLRRQMRASPHTVAGYRDTFRLLLRFAACRLHVPPERLVLSQVDASLIGHFLRHLDVDRGNSARSRNTRPAAIRSFFRYVALNEPAHALDCQRVLAMPNRRHERSPVAFLEPVETEALLSAPDTSSWRGRRDRTLLLVALQTGLRVSELVGLRCEDVELGTGAHVRCEGKGRKHRATPLRKDAVAMLAAWMTERGGHPADPLFPTATGSRLSRDAVERLVKKHTVAGSRRCPSLAAKKVTPHVLRHSAAMDLLRHGVDRTVIAMWLGHESANTTQIYLHADPRLKEEALARTQPTGARPTRYRPPDRLLAFLEGL